MVIGEGARDGKKGRFAPPGVLDCGMRSLAIVVAAAWLAACHPAGPSRCDQICAIEARCAAEHEAAAAGAIETECARACAIFERDPERVDEVEARAACIEAAGDCGAVLVCVGD